MGGWVGLNYQSVEFLFKIFKVKNRRELWEDLSEIERGALSVLNEPNAKG